MSTKTVVLTDVAAGIWADSYELRESADLRLRGSSEWAIRKRTLRGGLSDRVDVVELHNGAFCVSILPTRGMGLWRGQFHGIEIGWSSPVKEPVNPCFINLADRSGSGWLAGFNELLCRCGLSSNGPPGPDTIVDDSGHQAEALLTLHGRIANTPAHRVEVAVSTEGDGLLSVSGVVDEAMLFGPCLRLSTTCETVPGSNRLTIRDEIVNQAGTPAELQLLYHTNLGPPFLDGGARLVAPFREVAPRDLRAAGGIKTWQTYRGPTKGYSEECYYAHLVGDEHDRTLVLLSNAAKDRGISLEYSIRELPCFTLWKCTQAAADGYVTGLEPATNFPNHKSFERKQGRVVTIPPGGSYATRLDLAIHASATEVASVEKTIGERQNLAHPIIHERPIAKYSPVG